MGWLNCLLFSQLSIFSVYTTDVCVSVAVTVLQGSWCSHLSLDPCTADRKDHTGGTCCVYSSTLLPIESHRKQHHHTFCLTYLPLFDSLHTYRAYLSYHLSDLMLWCILVAPINSQLLLFSFHYIFLTSPAQKQLYICFSLSCKYISHIFFC